MAAAAEILGIPILRTADVNDGGAVAALHARRLDLLVVVAFGQILREEVLGLPRLGAVNLHFSLLPRWRGAAPVQRALEAGDAVTGVSVQRIVKALDAGPVVASREEPVGPDETAEALEGRLADLGAALLADVVSHAADTGTLIPGKPQDPSGVTHARKVSREDGRADFALPPEVFRRRVRAFHDWPRVTATLHVDGRAPLPVHLHRVEALAAAATASAAPGTVLAAGPAGIDVACGGGALRIRRLQRPGGNPLDAGEFLNGCAIRPGDRLG